MSEKIQEMIDDCLSAASCSNHKFSAWECDFIESVEAQFNQRKSVTEKQQQILERIWEKI